MRWWQAVETMAAWPLLVHGSEKNGRGRDRDEDEMVNSGDSSQDLESG